MSLIRNISTGTSDDSSTSFSPRTATNVDYVLPKEYIIWKLNERMFAINFPCFCCLIVAFILGVFGNSTAIYVFGFKLRRNKTNIFTTWLAGYDLLSSLLLIFETFDKRYPMYSGNFGVICKLVRVVIVVANSSSAFLLLGIAFDRYFKVCKPLKRYSSKTMKGTLVAAFIVPWVCVWPIAVFHGPEKRPTPYEGVYGNDCADDDRYVDMLSGKLFFFFMLLVIVASIIILIVLYVAMFLAMRKWKNHIIGENFRIKERTSCSKAANNQPNKCTGDVLSVKEISCKNECVHTENVKDGDRYNKGRIPSITENDQKSTYKNNDTRISTKSVNKETGRKSKSSSIKSAFSDMFNSLISIRERKKKERLDSVSVQKDKRRRQVGITTLMFALVSLLYICSFLPTLTMEALNGAGVLDVQTVTSFVGRQLIVIANMSYVLNGSFNPVIYIACNKSFRSEVKNLFRSA